MATDIRQFAAPDGPGSVGSAPNLPAGFTDTFSSRIVDTAALRQHVVVGGDGPPLLLVHGWPENWYAWRFVMPSLARDFTVIAVDQRGIGLTEKPEGGYDAGTLAGDMIALMDALGHERFAVVGHDIGLVISYALASDHPDRVASLAVMEVPGPPTPDHSPPLFAPAAVNNKLWHIAFNRAGGVAEELVAGNERFFYGYEFTIQGGSVSDEAINYYVDLVSTPDSLRGSFAFYREWDTTMAQNGERATTALAMPVLGIGGERSWAGAVGGAMTSLAEDARTAVIPGAGHWIAEEAPDALVATLNEFLAAFRATSPAPVG